MYTDMPTTPTKVAINTPITSHGGMPCPAATASKKVSQEHTVTGACMKILVIHAPKMRMKR